MRYQPTRTLDDVRNRGAKRVYVAVQTTWWNDRPTECRRPDSGLPCCPRGSRLEEQDQHHFLRLAEVDPSYFGKHGLTALEAALHGNIVTDEGRPTAVETWHDVNRLIDEWIVRTTIGPGVHVVETVQ